MKILITGSSGMIGSELVNELKKDNDVSGVDYVNPVYVLPPRFYKLDLREKIPPNTLRNDYDVIIHLAANARVYDLVVDPDLALDNVITEYNVLEFARYQKNHPLVLIASSREVYGNEMSGRIEEVGGSQRSAASPYAASKISNEAFAWAYKRCYDLNVVIMRFSNVYGRFDFSDRFIPKLCRQMMKNEDVIINGADKTLDFTYITDTISGIIHLIVNRENLTMEYNIASGEASKLVDVAQMLKERIKSDSKILIGDNLTGEVIEFSADISRIKKLGWVPRVALPEGLDKSISYYSSC